MLATLKWGKFEQPDRIASHGFAAKLTVESRLETFKFIEGRLRAE
jgi:hypothetical protein